MEKFSRVLRGYDPNEVNDFLDKVIAKVFAKVQEAGHIVTPCGFNFSYHSTAIALL